MVAVRGYEQSSQSILDGLRLGNVAPISVRQGQPARYAKPESAADARCDVTRFSGHCGFEHRQSLTASVRALERGGQGFGRQVRSDIVLDETQSDTLAQLIDPVRGASASKRDSPRPASRKPWAL